MVDVVEIPADLLRTVSASWWIGRRHVTSTQPWTRHLRASGPIDERWIVEITLQTKVTRAEIDRFETIFDMGGGLSGTYSAFDNVHAWPRGTASGLDIDGAGATFSDGSDFSDGSTFMGGAVWCLTGAASERGAEYLTLTGLEVDQALGFARGDHVAICEGGGSHGFLHKIIGDASTDATGAASIRVAPRLRKAVAAGTMVRLHQPRGVFRLASEDFPTVSREAGGFGQPSLSLVEAPEALLCAS